jgi:predicted nucleic acid-binding protein
MTAKVFVDTNVLIYARDAKAAGKRLEALAWLDALALDGRLTINLQVMNELARWLLRNDPSRPADNVRREVEAMKRYGDAVLTDQDVALAWDVRGSLGYQWFDCLLIAAASLGGCRYFLSEDMSDGARFRHVTIINPFRHKPADLLRTN